MSEKTEFFFTADVHVPGLDDALFDKVQEEFDKNELAIEPGLGGIIPLEALLILFIVEEEDIYDAGVFALDVLSDVLFKSGVEDYELIRYGVAAPVDQDAVENELADEYFGGEGAAFEAGKTAFSESTNELEPAEILKLEDVGL